MKKRNRLFTIMSLSVLCFIMMFALTACQGIGNKKPDIMVDWKELEDPRGVYPEEGTQTGETKPQIVETKYATEEVVVADIIPTEMGYAVDATGKKDSTDGIQQALFDCYNAGGGTVYLPAGNYAITDTIYVPSYVTLRGDWQDPDKGTEYGTIFSVWMDPSDSKEGGAFMMSSCSGVVGATVYYPFQTLYEVVTYPCTFYIEDGAMLTTLKDITVINGYRGIGTSYDIPHECLLIENFKGTFLDYGLYMNNSADVGTMENVTFSAKYWKEAKSDYMNRPVAVEIDKYVKENATGLIMSDLEWTDFANVTVEGYSVGMRFVEGFRYKFAGAMIDIHIKDCEKGFLVETADERWGMVVARSEIEGSLTNAWIAKVRTMDTKITGEISEFGPGSVEQQDVDLSEYKIDYDASYKKPKAKLSVVQLAKGVSEDVSEALQKALNEQAVVGGGIVYVPGGTYRLDKPISIPAGVELRGASSVASRELLENETQGTLFLCYYGDDASFDAEKDAALITLAGKSAGLSGIRILYPENGPRDTDLNTTYTIRGGASNVYVVNCYIGASAYGMDMRGCNNHFLKSNYTGCYYNTYRVGGTNGKIVGCLNNPNMVERTLADGRVNWMEVGKLSDEVINPISRPNHQAIIVQDAENQLIYNTFSYGSKNLIVNNNSKDTLAVNIGSDNLNENEAQLINNRGDMTVINSLRFNGHSYDNIDGQLKLYNRITMDEPDEKMEVVGKED